MSESELGMQGRSIRAALVAVAVAALVALGATACLSTSTALAKDRVVEYTFTSHHYSYGDTYAHATLGKKRLVVKGRLAKRDAGHSSKVLPGKKRAFRLAKGCRFRAVDDFDIAMSRPKVKHAFEKNEFVACAFYCKNVKVTKITFHS